ncbi:SCO7613 C-terminal domain-containing membrane protein [Bifidobacterium callimiconis]|uniref:Uncharacterized protein n=1 Tax=Bifidobacterium callimiconis TaxID=2306973 RepID=A0A430FCL9_9BIFI|nr:hypothetical protein [Bifidobacterium callimiconis]RSX50551.1 hypothetical protein D2E23_1574 [Bifidobacterium callimiconis]
MPDPVPEFHPSTPSQPIAWPVSTAQLRDSTLNPDDFSPIRGRFTPTGLDLEDPRCATVLELSRSAADLLDERARLIDEIRSSTTTAVTRTTPVGPTVPQTAAVPPATPPAQPTQPTQPTPMSTQPQLTQPQPQPTAEYAAPSPQAFPDPPQPLGPHPFGPQLLGFQPQTPTAFSQSPTNGRTAATVPRRSRASAVQVLLLVLGVGLIGLAVSVFAFLTYPLFGNAARTICIAVTGFIGLAVSAAIGGKTRVTAEGVAWASFFALTTASVLASKLGPIPRLHLRDLVTGLMLLMVAAIAMALSLATAKRATPTRAYSLAASLLTPPALAMIGSTSLLGRTGQSLTVITLMAVVLVAAYLLPASRLPDAERLLMTLESSFILMVIGLGDFANPNHVRYAAATSLAAYAVPMIIATLMWIRTAAGPQAVRPTPSERPMSPVVPIPVTQSEHNPQPVTPVPPTPGAQSMPDSRSRQRARTTIADANRWILTIITSMMGVGMMGLSLTNDYRPLPPDVPAALFGVAALVIGSMWMRRRPALRSWPALWPGLTTLLAPMLLVSWNERWARDQIVYGTLPGGMTPASPGHTFPVREILLFVIALAVLIAGALLSWQAPLIAGTATLILHVIVLLWSWIVMFSLAFWWVWLAVGGILLVTIADRYERSLGAAKTLVTRISQLR